MVAKVNRTEEILDELSHISKHLTIIEAQQEYLGTMSVNNSVDIAARLNAQRLVIQSLLDPMKDRIKSLGMADPSGVVRGKSYKACVKSVIKTVLDTETIKTFLGARLHRFQMQRKEVSVSFEVLD